jgi:phage-related protein
VSLEIGVLTLGVDVDDRRATAGLDRVERKAKSSGSSIGGSLGKGAGIGLAAVAGATVAAAAGVGMFAASSVKAAQDSAVANARFDQVSKSMGYMSGAYAGATQRAKDYASEVSKQIGVDDDSIMVVQAKLATFKAVGDTMNVAGGSFDRATKAAYDLGAAGFGTAEQNAVQLGKALQDPIKGISALARSGVTFTAQEKEKIKALAESGQMLAAQDMVLKAVEGQVGGVAEKTATATDKMQVGWGELQETVGGALLPTLNTLATTLTPLFEQMSGPLSTLASTLGKTLGDAFQKIAPMLPSLVANFATLATSVGGPLVSAIAAIMPSLTPFLAMAGDLATRIAPVLSKVLGKVAEVFAKILEALAPLLPPLIDLVFTILDAAMPIFELVADLVLSLVDALKPLLDVVVVLAAPIGMLVKMLGDLLTPILKAVSPLISTLAEVLGTILSKAIGVVILALGYLIKAAAKVAPFFIDNVIRPILSAYTEFASQMVTVGAEAFSWLPGIGDEIVKAKDAVTGFLAGADSMLSGFSGTITTEGAAIGDALIKAGSDAVNGTAGKAAGKSYMDGMASGVASGQIPASALNPAGSVAVAIGKTPTPKPVVASNLPSPTGKAGTSGLPKNQNPVNGAGKSCDKKMQEAVAKGAQEGTEKGLENKLDIESPFERTLRTVSSSALTGKTNGSMTSGTAAATTTAVTGGSGGSKATVAGAGAVRSGTGDGTVINVTVNASGGADKATIKQAVAEGIGEAFKRSRTKLTAVGAM